jgi:hypothetical protein
MGDDGRLFTARSVGDGTFDGFRYSEDISTNSSSRGVVIADFTGNDNFDLITGYAADSRLQLYLYQREAGNFTTPVYLGQFDTANPGWLMDMAAEDFDNDADMDFVVDTNSARAWYFENTGSLVTTPENFFASDFETGTEGWGGQQARTTLARDDTTSASGTWSMRVSASGTPTTLSIDINPSAWLLSRGSRVRFDYRIPAGTPVGLLFNVSGRDWIQLGGTASADPGVFTVAPAAVTLIDDDTWRSVEIDVYQAIREVWPDASLVTEFQWWTNNNATAGQQFWFDDFRITRPRMVSGFSATLLPDTGGNGRGMDAGDAEATWTSHVHARATVSCTFIAETVPAPSHRPCHRLRTPATIRTVCCLPISITTAMRTSLPTTTAPAIPTFSRATETALSRQVSTSPLWTRTTTHLMGSSTSTTTATRMSWCRPTPRGSSGTTPATATAPSARAP